MSAAQGLSGTRCWTVTIVATVASTFALDAAATVTGMALAAAHVLRGLSHPVLLGLLAGSYVAWGIGLRANLIANAMLLEQTGASTNALSKAAFDVARRHGGTQSRLRLASAIGYVVAELVKEVPYYAGAFGAAVLTDSVSSADAIIFLAGTNLGAAIYEYGLARLTRPFVAVRAHRVGGAACQRSERRPPANTVHHIVTPLVQMTKGER